MARQGTDREWEVAVMTGHAFAVLFVAFVLALLAAMIVGLVLHAGMVPTLSGPL